MLSGSLFREYFRSRLAKGEILPPPLHPKDDFEGEAPISDSTPSEPTALEDSPEDGEDTDTQAAAGGNGEASPNTSQHEEKARAYWNKVIEYITKRITLLDFRFVISKDKDTFQRELKELVGSDNMHLLDIIGAMNVGFHNLYYHLRTGGGCLPNIIMSTYIWNIVYSLCDPDYQAKAAQLCGYIPHPECFLAGYIKDVLVYDDDLVNYFDSVIEAGFAEIFRQVFGVDDHSSSVARRFNRGLLTDEEVAALKDLLLKIRIKGGTTCAKMRQLIKAIMDRLLSKDITGIDTEEEAFDLLPGILRRLRARHASDPTVGVDAMMEDEGKEEEAEEEMEDEEEDTDDDDGTDYSVYVDACYDTYKELINQCDKKSRENIYKLVAKLRSLYKGSAKTGLMQTLASKLFGIGGLDSDCENEQITAKLEECMEAEGGASDDILVAFTKLHKYAPEVVNDLISLAEKLRNMYLGSILGVETSRLMRSLANSILGTLGKDCEDRDVLSVLQKLKRLHEDKSQDSEIDSSSDASSHDEQNGDFIAECLVAYTALVDHAPRFLSSDNFDSLVNSLQSMYRGSILGGETSRLMRSLATSIFGSLGETCNDDDVVTELKRLKSLHDDVNQETDESEDESNDDKQSNSSASSDNESGESDGSRPEEAFAALVGHAPQYADPNCFASLATKLRSMFMGSKTSGLMHTLASAMLDQFKADGLGDTIIDKLESLHQQYKSSLNNDGRGSSGGGFVSRRSSSEFDVTVREAYLALVTHKPGISDDFSSLVSLISYYSLNDEATFKQNLKQLKKYIQDNFNNPNGRFANSDVKFVYSRKADGSFDSLYVWWSAVIGYATHHGLVPQYKKASGEQLRRLREILGDNFDNYPSIDAAIEAAKSQKHEKKDTAATKKKKGKRRFKRLFGSNNTE